jgi:predicted RNase H-like HicB family nuclease
MEAYIDKYRTVIQWSEEDSAFIAAIPVLPGCMADGATREDALRNLNTTAELWIAKARKMGREIPEPEKELVFAA